MKTQDEIDPPPAPSATGEPPTSATRMPIKARLKAMYEENPIGFAFGLMCASGLVFLLGGLLSGDLDASSFTSWP